MNEFEKQVEHLTTLAMTSGWWTYAQARAMELDALTAFAGIRAAVKDKLKASGFRPMSQELHG